MTLSQSIFTFLLTSKETQELCQQHEEDIADWGSPLIRRPCLCVCVFLCVWGRGAQNEPLARNNKKGKQWPYKQKY